jgi:hypothetical protein
MRGVSWRIVLIIAIVCLALSVGLSYAVVASQSPKPPSQPLYGPSDFAR